MKLSDVKDLAMIAAIGVGAYLIYKLVSGASNAGKSAGELIAQIWANLNQPPPIGVYGSAILPNGAVVPFQTLFVNDQMQFTYAGHVYKLTAGHDENGNYPTALVS